MVEDQSDENIINYAAIFTYYLFGSWRLPTTCESESDKIIIFYSKADGVVGSFCSVNTSKWHRSLQSLLKTTYQVPYLTEFMHF